MTAYLGGDPGKGGAFAVVTEEGYVEAWPMPSSEVDTIHLCREIAEQHPGIRGWVEKVASMPRQGVKSMFTFGGAYKEMRMGLLAAGIGFDDVTPRSWQKYLGLHKSKAESSTQWKNRLKAKAQQLFPDTKITLKTADAILIAYAHMKTNR